MGVREVKIRLLQTFGGYKAGQVFDWSDGMARIYVARGLAVPVEERAVETATLERREERAVVQQPVRRKQK